MYEEIELKLVLGGAADADRLLSLVRLPYREELQENLYFDDPSGLLARSKIGVRLRCMPEGGLLTVKGEGSSVGGLSTRPEAEQRLSLRATRELLSNPNLILPRLTVLLERLEVDSQCVDGLGELRVVGRMHTRRRRATLATRNYELPLEIDETTYPDNSIVFELEVEFDRSQDIDAARRELREFLDEQSIRARPSDLSKRARLARILEGEEPG